MVQAVHRLVDRRVLLVDVEGAGAEGGTNVDLGENQLDRSSGVLEHGEGLGVGEVKQGSTVDGDDLRRRLKIVYFCLDFNTYLQGKKYH